MKPARRLWWEIFCVVALAAVLAVTARHMQRTANDDKTRDRFKVVAERAVVRLDDLLRTYEYGLRGARGAIIGAGLDAITRARFRDYAESRDLAGEFPGALGFGFIRLVTLDDESRFVAAARADGWPTFTVRQLAPVDDTRYVIQYIEPVASNGAAVGLDIASERRRRDAAMEAARTGRPTLTAPIDLVQLRAANRTGFLLLLPIYRPGLPHGTEAERVAAVAGWSYSPLAIAQVMETFALDGGTLELRMSDVGAGASPFFETPGFERAVSGQVTVTSNREILGRHWRVEIAATPRFITELGLTDPDRVAWALGFTSLLFGGVLAAYWTGLRRRLAVRAERDRLAAIVDSSDDAIIAEDLAGLVTSWNEGATRLFGYSAAEQIGRPLARIYPPSQLGAIAALRERARRGEPCQQIEAVRLHKDGHELRVSVTKSPVRNAAGEIVGLSIIAHDISARVAAEAALRASDQRFRELAQSLPLMVWTCDGEGSCDYLSPQWVAYTGIPAEPQLGYGWLAQVHPDDLDRTRAAWASATDSGGTFDVEFRVRRHDGVYRWFATRAAPTMNTDGKPARWFGSNTDIQDLREAQENAVKLNNDLEARVAARTEDLRAATMQAELIVNQLRIAQRVSQVGSYSLDLTTGERFWSDELRHLMGIELDGPLPEFGDAAYPLSADSQQATNKAIERSGASGEPFEIIVEFRRPDGQMRIASARGEPVRNEHGAITHVTGTFQDVTERETSRKQLERASERLRLASSAARIGIWDWDVVANALVWDDTMHEIYGTPGSGPEGPYEMWRNALHPDDLAGTEGALQAALAGERDYDPLFRIIRPDGEVRYIRAAATVHRDPSTGQAVRVVGTNIDVTEQQNAEIKLRNTEALQRGILTGVGSAMIATTPDGVITLFNRTAEDLLGFRADEMVGHATPALFHDGSELGERKTVLEAEGFTLASDFDVFTVKAHQGRSDVNEWTYVRKDGLRVPVLLTVSALRDDLGGLFGYLGIAADLSKQKAQQAELAEANRLLAERTAQAESANKAKTMFLANMSHEIRTPMGAITGVTYLLQRTRLSSDQADLVGTIERSTKTLMSMINDVLDLSKVEAGQLTIDATPFSLSQALADVGDLMVALDTNKRLELVHDFEPDLPEFLVGDRVRLTQILTNLIANAIKFTSHGHVRLGVQKVAEAAERVWLAFEVDDTGPGMPEDLLARLFKPFVQGGTSTSQRAGGTGLGLAIVKELAALMGGEISVASTLGVGSRFRCKLPFVRSLPDRHDLAEPLSILIVDDDEAQLTALSAAGKRLAWHAATATSGPHALALIDERSQADRPFDVVVLDWRMPGMDGLETLKRIRKSLGDRTAPLGAIVATAHDLDALCQNPDSALADVLLRKPVTASELFTSVAAALRQRQPLRGSTILAAPLATMRNLPGVRVLVVDDSDVNRDIARRILELEGAVVATANSGAHAIACLAAPAAHFDAVLMDVQMSDLDGVEATRQIRREASHRKLPIIALTAGALATERARALDAGMSDFVTKPFDPAMLIATVRRHVSNHREIPIGVEPIPIEASVGDWPTIEGIDTAESQSRLGNDVQLFRRLLDRFVTELEALTGIAGPYSRDQLSELAAQVHRMSGIAGNLAAKSLHAAAVEAEHALRSGQTSVIEATLRRVADEAKRIRASVDVSRSQNTSHKAKASAPTQPLDPETWARFIHQLRDQQLDALLLFDAHSDRILARLGNAKGERLRLAVEALDFETALALVVDDSQGVDVAQPVAEKLLD